MHIHKRKNMNTNTNLNTKGAERCQKVPKNADAERCRKVPKGANAERCRKVPKVKHMFLSLGACHTLWGVVHSGIDTLCSIHETN